ncbi:hypothetical protein OHC33_003153 [Knufia fluminis]|uniref:Uncharacterized protein n=1 Tax=Knufia fluminis TaxID=191047 RepID=A0AAN8F321_9EURO|nr:hypothetical protein OHC33_003153 [Knufia fluminis]
MSQNNPQDLESGSDSMEMTRDAGNRANGDAPTRAGRGTALNERGTPILPNTRMPSYGSCDEDKAGSVAKDEPGRGHPLRHQIGSDVLDFGDSPLIWPGPLTRRLLDKKRRMMLSWLGSSKACSSSRSTVKRKDSISAPDTASRVQPPIPSIPHHIINRFETKLGGDGPTPLTTKGKTVFSLFGLDAAQAEASANIDTELEDLTNKPARPRANAISVPNGRSELLKQVTQTAAPDKPRCLSITKYLEEISKIGANGTEQSDRATAPAAAGSATIKNGAVHGPGELQDDVHKAALQQLKTETSPGANGESISDPLQQHAHVIPSQDVGKSKEPKIRQHATAGIASTEHEMNRMIEHNPYPSTPRTTPGRTDHDAPAVVKAVTGSKPLRASSKARSPATPQRAKSSSKPKQVKTAKPNAPDKSKDMSTATSPGFTGMLQAADKGAVARVGSKQRKEREGVCAGKR